MNLPLIKNPDYLIIECNHDISMLLKTNRPFELKERIMSEHGHLCNEDSAIAAISISGDKTKEIILAHISEEANVAMKRSQLRSNDILVTIAGRLGSAAIVSEHILPANTNQAVALIRMKKEYGHLVNYIYRVISSSSMQKRLQGSNAQSIQKNLTLPILGDIEFVQDSNCEIIKRFNEITKPIFLRQQENIQEITRLTALRDKLLPLLMNGQVVVG